MARNEQATPRPRKKLTRKQRKFVRAYLTAPNSDATQAAEEAGYTYPYKDGRRMLKSPLVMAAIISGQARRDRRSLKAVLNEGRDKAARANKSGATGAQSSVSRDTKPEPAPKLSPLDQWRRDRATLTAAQMIAKYPGDPFFRPSPPQPYRPPNTRVISEFDPLDPRF